MKCKLIQANRKYIFRRVIVTILFSVFCLDVLEWFVARDLKHRVLEVDFFNVGEGESIFIRTPQGNKILIDGGPSLAVLEKLGREMPFWDRSIDLVVLTNPEHSYMLGLIQVLKNYKVKNVLWTGIDRQTSEYREWLKLIRGIRSNIYIAQAGRKIIFGNPKHCGFNNARSCGQLEILSPFKNLDGRNVKKVSKAAVVLRLTFGKKSFLFTSDVDKSIEHKLINQSIPLGSDVLTVSHYGSKSSSADNFIKSVSPSIAIISVSGDNSAKGKNCDNKERNRYGYPSCEVLATLKKFGIKVLRTDLNGDIKIFCDGKKFRIKTQYPISYF